MDIQEILYNYKGQIILGALIIAGLGFLGFLPEELPVLGENSHYLYLILMGIAGYTYYEFHYNSNYGPKPVSLRRTVPSRDLSSGSYRKEVARQRGPVSRAPIPPIAGGTPSDSSAPSKRIFETFKQD